MQAADNSLAYAGLMTVFGQTASGIHLGLLVVNLITREVKVGDFAGDGYQWFALPTDWPGPPSLMETRVYWHGKAALAVDRVALFRLAR